MNDEEMEELAQFLFKGQDLHFAAQSGDLAEVRRLLEQGEPVGSFDDAGNTPLHYAAEHGHVEAINALISAGADVNAQDLSRAGDTPLGHVAGNCDLEIAKILIAAGADPTRAGGMQLTPLDKAKRRKRGDGPAVYSLLLAAVRASGRV